MVLNVLVRYVEPVNLFIIVINLEASYIIGGDHYLVDLISKSFKNVPAFWSK